MIVKCKYCFYANAYENNHIELNSCLGLKTSFSVLPLTCSRQPTSPLASGVNLHKFNMIQSHMFVELSALWQMSFFTPYILLEATLECGGLNTWPSDLHRKTLPTQLYLSLYIFFVDIVSVWRLHWPKDIGKHSFQELGKFDNVQILRNNIISDPFSYTCCC